MTSRPQVFTDAYGDILTISPRDAGGAHFDPGRGNTNEVLHFDTATLREIRDRINIILRAADPITSDPRNQPGHPAYHDRLTWLPPTPSTEYRHTEDGTIERVTPPPADWVPAPTQTCAGCGDDNTTNRPWQTDDIDGGTYCPTCTRLENED